MTPKQALDRILVDPAFRHAFNEFPKRPEFGEAIRTGRPQAASTVPAHVAGSDTSFAAAQSMKAQAPIDKTRVLATIACAGARGMTCDELETHLNGRHQSVSARVHELAKAGAIVDSGERRKTRSGRKAAVYVAKVKS